MVHFLDEGGEAVELIQAEKHPLFAGVEEGLLAETLSAVEHLTARRGETIYSEGRFRRCLGLLLEGRVQVKKGVLLMSTLRAGDLFGAAALFSDGADYPTTLTARTDCRVLLIPQEEVRRLLREDGAFAENYVTYLSGRIQFLTGRLGALSAGSAEGKLAQYLLTNGGEVTLSAAQLCQRIGVGRATLYRAFEALEAAGAIARAGKTIRVTDGEKLRGILNNRGPHE